MEVSGSILAVKDNYLEYAKSLQSARIDYLHIDIFQNSGDFKLEDILQFDDSYLPLDVHLIYEQLTDYDIEILNKANIKYCNIQYENLKNKELIYEVAKKFKGSLGLAITSNTPVEEVESYIKVISQLLFMCSEPGVSGARLDVSNFKRIAQVRDKYPSLKLFADGGIDNIVAEKMGKLGVSVIISGSYLCKNIDNLNSNIYKLKYLNEVNINASRNMIRYKFLPVLSEDAGFIDILNLSNRFKLGIIFVVEDEALKGVISDGDIRRGILGFGKEIFEKKAADLMNHCPLTIESTSTIEDIFSHMPSMQKGIEVIPVVENGKLIGAIDLT